MENRTIRYGGIPAGDMTASQRALELRKFFEPFYPDRFAGGLKATINCDGALDAFAETVLWRLRGVRVMVSLIDRTTQYFLAGASRNGDDSGNDSEDDIGLDRTWFGCSNIPTHGGLCENTLAINCAADKYPCFIVNDLREDERFAHLSVVDGSVKEYRFYAGTPITTDNGINIGSFFIFDDKPRKGLTMQQRKFLFEAASNVMRYLETKREAAARRRIALMSKGIASFLETTSHVTESDIEASDISRKNSLGRKTSHSDHREAPPNGREGDLKGDEDSSSKVLDQIKLTLDQAADILRESLEITAGGVMFLDTALGYRDSSTANSYFDISTDIVAEQEEPLGAENRMLFNSTLEVPALTSAGAAARGVSSPGQLRSLKPAKILAKSVSESAQWSPTKMAPDGKTLQNLISVYPKGNVWYIDDEGYFSSIEQVDDVCNGQVTSPSGKRRPRASFNIARQTVEADSLLRVFTNARQIIFLPLWDAGGNRWYAGCFVWSQAAVPVFSVDPEIAYLSAFTNSMMVEISRLEAITANKMKSDFISSISHEFRSPLHGILAGVEFLRDSELDSTQTEFISTIQNCGSTLLDTINHVLDYNKINSFEKMGRETGSLSNELYQTSDVALLCEDIVYGMMAAKEFQGITESSSPKRQRNHRHSLDSHVHIILDIEHRDWNYRFQSGALRRIIMNIFGNATKYTDSGYILVKLRIREVEKGNAAGTGTSPQHVLEMKIIDSGRGMSTEYMERKLFTPFAQEDSFAPGIGLGLSIVWSIVNQLGGTIHIRSVLGKGTDVEVNLPLERCDGKTICSGMTRSDTEVHGSTEAQQCVEAVRNIASGRTVAIIRDPSDTPEQACVGPKWQCIENCLATWFNFKVINSFDQDASNSAALIITDSTEQNLGRNMKSQLSAGLNPSRVLQIREGMTCIQENCACSQNCVVERIWSPIGPYKLARALRTLFKDQINGQPPISSPPVALMPMPTVEHTISDASHIGPPELLPIRSAFDVIYKPEPLKIPATTTATITSNTDSGPAQALKNMLALPIQQDNPPDLTSKTFAPGMLSPDIENGASLRILVVDDNILNLQLLNRYLLKRPNYTVATARNGVEAVAAVRQAKTSFDIILMDLSMPDMDGFEATRLIRLFEKSLKHREACEIEGNGMRAQQARSNSEDRGGERGQRESNETRPSEYEVLRQMHAYIVALTGLASRRDRDEAEESGFDDFLTKPISFGKIGELLARVSAEKFKGKELSG